MFVATLNKLFSTSDTSGSWQDMPRVFVFMKNLDDNGVESSL
jgi:hypothetical protein